MGFGDNIDLLLFFYYLIIKVKNYFISLKKTGIISFISSLKHFFKL